MAIGSGAVLGGMPGRDGVVRFHWRRTPWATWIQWLHLCSLFTLLSVVGVASMILIDGLAFGPSLTRLPATLFWWVPPVLGIVAAATPVRDHSRRRIAGLIFVGIALLIVLDSLGAATQSQAPLTAALADGEWVRQGAPVFRAQSMLHTLWMWASGELGNVSERLTRYPTGHPRSLVRMALADSSALLLAVGTVGVLVALRRWIDDNVIFRTNSNELVVGAVLGWIASPSLMIMVASLTGRRASAVMFDGDPLLSVWLPGGVYAALGILGVFYALRRAQ